MKQILILFVLTIGACGTSLYGQLTIEKCQDKAFNNYPMIKQYELISKSTDYSLSNANKAFLPHISITGIGGYIFGGLAAASQSTNQVSKFQLIGIGQINQTIWDGGANRTQKDIIKANAEVEKSTVEVSLYSIRERVNQIYFGVLLIEEQLHQLEILNDNLNVGLNKVKLAKENGLAYQTDVDELYAEILHLEQRKIEFRYTRKAYLEMLSLFTGDTLNENTRLEKPVVMDSAESLSNKRPELSLYSNQLKLLEAQSSIDKVNNMPKIGLLGAAVFLGPGVSIGTAKFNSVGVAGLSASWNTEGIFRSSNNKELHKIQMDKITNQKDSFLFNSNLQSQQATNDIEKQKAIMAKDEEIVGLKKAVKNGYQTKYEAGLCSMSDLIAAINKENEALSNQALHKVQYLMSIYNYKIIINASNHE